MALPDLHIHTIYSDGIDSPIEVVRDAKIKKIPFIGITDHFDEIIEYMDFFEYLNILKNIKDKVGFFCVSIESDVCDFETIIAEHKKNPVMDYIIVHDIKSIDEIKFVGEKAKKLQLTPHTLERLILVKRIN